MTILVSGASGRLGRPILERLIARGVPASEPVAGARSPGKAPIHAVAERAIAAAGLRAVILRNHSYSELSLGPVLRAQQSGLRAGL